MKEKSFRWQDVALMISLGLTGVVAIKVFLGSGNNGHSNGHAPPQRMGRRGGMPPQLPPGYGPTPGYDVPPGAIPYQGGPPPQRRYQQYPPDQAGQQPPQQMIPTPGSQNTIGRQIMPQGQTEYAPQDQTVHGTGMNRIRMANYDS